MAKSSVSRPTNSPTRLSRRTTRYQDGWVCRNGKVNRISCESPGDWMPSPPLAITNRMRLAQLAALSRCRLESQHEHDRGRLHQCRGQEGDYHRRL